jgi:hypothetical protein
MAASKHVHKYHHIFPGNGPKLWSCALPGCSHHMPRHYENTLVGKFSICWGCNKQFILDESSMEMDKPICSNCLHPIPEPILELTKKFNESSNELEKDDTARKLAELLKD